MLRIRQSAFVLAMLIPMFVGTVEGFSPPQSSNTYIRKISRWNTHSPSSTNSRCDETRLHSLTDDDFMASLRNRVQEVEKSSETLPLVVLDSMLPRQVLKIQANNPLLMELVGDRIKNEMPFIGMMGMAKLASGQNVHLKSGVEVEIINPEFVDGGIRMELRGGRRFRIEGHVKNADERGWTEAQVEFLDSEEEEEAEISEGDDRMSVARAISKSTEWTSPNMNTEGNSSLVDRWISLAKENEREPGQIDRLLEQLGEIPPPECPSERAFWVGALINPLPAMGVALEIRPALLTAKTAEERVHIASQGILKSIKHMDGSARLW